MTPFRPRGAHTTRIEVLSDAVFGFSLTLLVVSLEVPRTFSELMDLSYGFVPFAFCFALFVHIWYLHNRYFHRYGLEDAPTVWLNSVLLFVVMYFVYPMKFLVTVVVKAFSGVAASSVMDDGSVVPMITWQDSNMMVILFGAGYVAIHTTFVLLYWRAYRLRTHLDLTGVERFDTLTALGEHAIYVGVGLASMTMAAAGGPSWAAASGWFYGIQGPVMWWYGSRNAKRRERIDGAA